MSYATTYFGEAVNWECDELGHLNMRHYLGKCVEARQFFTQLLGLDGAYRTGATSTLRTREATICYLAETRPGGRLRVETGVLEIHDHALTLHHVMYHADGRMAATVREVVEHVYLPTESVFAWPKRVSAAVETYRIPTPVAGPRGLDMAETPTHPEEDRLKEWDLELVGSGAFQPREADMSGRIEPVALLGRFTESVGNFDRGFPEHFNPPERLSGRNISGVLLEMRLFIRRAPRAGDSYRIYSAVRGAVAATRQLVHHMVDPVSGRSWCSAAATSGLFDLDSRKLVKSSEAELAALMKHATPQAGP